MGVVANICPGNLFAHAKLCPSGYVARISRRQNTGHIQGIKSAANKRVYTVPWNERKCKCLVYSRLLSVQWQHDNIVHLSVTEIQAICMKAVTKKEWKRKKRYLMFNFHWQKSSQQRKTARYCKTTMKSKIVSFGSYVWLFFTRFPANRDCLLLYVSKIS